MSPRSIDRHEVRRLVADGALLAEVLPDEEFAEERLPGAVHLPLKSLTAETVADFDRARPIVVYCWDGL